MPPKRGDYKGTVFDRMNSRFSMLKAFDSGHRGADRHSQFVRVRDHLERINELKFFSIKDQDRPEGEILLTVADRNPKMTKEQLLAALDKPRTINALVTIVSPGGSGEQTAQTLLMEMRDEGLVKFDIKKGLWSRA